MFKKQSNPSNASTIIRSTTNNRLLTLSHRQSPTYGTSSYINQSLQLMSSVRQTSLLLPLFFNNNDTSFAAVPFLLILGQNPSHHCGGNRRASLTPFLLSSFRPIAINSKSRSSSRLLCLGGVLPKYMTVQDIKGVSLFILDYPLVHLQKCNHRSLRNPFDHPIIFRFSISTNLILLLAL